MLFIYGATNFGVNHAFGLDDVHGARGAQCARVRSLRAPLKVDWVGADLPPLYVKRSRLCRSCCGFAW